MAFKKAVDERNGKPVKFVSEAALSRMIADMQRKQQRILDGKTLRDAMPTNQFQGLRLSNFPAMRPEWRKL